MSTLVINECGVVTILPMGVNCNVENASTPISNDGVIYLTVTGGSTPYDITWSNGLKTKNLYNLYPGEYTATVVDYYGDYTATTTCLVESDSFYMDYFANCFNGELNYFTGLTQNQLILGGVYKFETTPGCWTYSGKTLYSGQTFTGDVLSEFFNTCEECDPPIVLPFYPIDLCLYSTNGTFDARPFTFYGFVNDKPAYTGTGVNNLSQSIRWTPGALNQWLVFGVSGPVLSNTNDTFNPLGGWILQGTQQSYIAVSGACPTAPALSMSVTKNDESCDGACDGSVIVTATGGSGGYTYSKDGSNYQVYPVFNGLCDQTLTVYTKDSNGTIVSQNVVINSGPKKTTYKVSLQTKQVNTQLNYGTQVSSTLEYVVNVTPSLPDGVEITVPISINVEEVTKTPGQTTVTYTPSLYSGGTSVSPSSNSLVNTFNQTYNFRNSTRYPWSDTTKTYSVKYNSLVLKKGLVISGKVETVITKINDGSSQNCQGSRNVYNPTSTTRIFILTNCTGGTETISVIPEDSFDFCSRTASSQTVTSNGLVFSPGSINCTNVTDGNIKVTANFNGPSMSNDCSLLQVQTPASQQLYSQLYQSQYQGNGL